MTGWVSLWRELYGKPIWANSSTEHKAVLVVLLGLVNHEPAEWEWKGESYTVVRGQTITSLQSIKVLCGKGVSIQNIRSALIRFEKLHFLTNESTKTGRKLTICNYDSYQKQTPQANKAINSQPTKTQQRPNKEVTPNNKDNNNNNDNNDNKKVNTLAKFVSAKEEILAHSKVLYPDKDNDKAIADFIESCEIKGYKYKKFDLAYYKWVREDRFNQYGQKSQGRKVSTAEANVIVKLVSWWSIIGTRETPEEMQSKAERAVKKYGVSSVDRAIDKMNHIPSPNLANFWAEVKK